MKVTNTIGIAGAGAIGTVVGQGGLGAAAASSAPDRRTRVSKRPSVLASACTTAGSGFIGLAWMVAGKCSGRDVRAIVLCPGLVHTPIGTKRIPKQAREPHMSDRAVLKVVMPTDVGGGERTTVDGVSGVVLMSARAPSNVLAGPSLVASQPRILQ